MPDFRQLAPRPDERNIRIELLRREVIADSQMRPQFGPRKVYLIEADYLAETGQNALLKTLEESPPGVYYLLTVKREEDLLPTVRSRAMRVHLGPSDTGQLEAILALHGCADAAQRRRFAAEADGLPGRALALWRAAREGEEAAGEIAGERALAGVAEQLWGMAERGRVSQLLTEGLSLAATERERTRALLDALSAIVARRLAARQAEGETAASAPPEALLRVEDCLASLRRALEANVHFDTAMSHLLITMHKELHHA